MKQWGQLSIFSVAFWALFLPLHASAQQMEAKAIAEDFVANDTVLELTVPKDYEGVSLFVVWDPERDLAKPIFARAGTHAYEMRNAPGWQGRIRALGITAPNITGRVKTPTFADEIDIFFEPRRFTVTSVNFLQEQTFLAIRLTVWSFGILALTTLILLIRRKRLPHAAAIAFLFSLAIVVARSIYDDVAVVSNTETYMSEMHGVFPLAGAKAFSENVAARIGRSSWGKGKIEGVFGSYVRYRLAEHTFVPAGSEERPTFWITRDPAEGTPIYQESNFYLMKAPSK